MDLSEDDREEAEEVASKWTDGEYIRVEFDTDEGTATVLENS